MNGDIPEFRRRYRYLVTVVAIVFAILLGRLWQVQVIHGEHYLKLSEDNFVQELRIPATRGLIFDRKHLSLVTNRPSFDVFIAPHFATETSIERLVEELSLPPDQAELLVRRVKEVTGKRRFNPLVVVWDISRDQLARLEMHSADLAGVTVVARAQRNYLQGNLAAHVLGYMNEVTAQELKSIKGENYLPGELIGRFGVERMYEAHLRGVPGRERIVVDARGHRKRGRESEELLGEVRRVEPVPGHNLMLTIDIEVQRLVERALRHYASGAAVVMEVDTGRILASASKPAFDPNQLTGHLSPDEVRRMLADPHRPLLDKVYREHYFPGSTYKVVPAIAALEGHLVSLEETITCKGWHSFGRRNFRCSHAHGNVSIHQAVVESCNVFFYTLAERVGMDTMARWARTFGLGAPTGVGLNGEVAGFIPTKDWYARQKEPFRIGFTLNSAIGQGNTKTTTIQMATLYAAIANGGRLYLPQIVERIETTDGQVVQRFSPRLRRRIPLLESTLELLHSSLTGVVNDAKGTAYTARIDSPIVAGKTGTAQVSRSVRKGKTIWLQDHSWFAAFAPAARPAIAVAVLIEHGGRAAKVAAPVAMEIIKGYFRYVEPGSLKKTADARQVLP